MRFFKLYILQNEVSAFSQPGFMSIFKSPNITMLSYFFMSLFNVVSTFWIYLYMRDFSGLQQAINNHLLLRNVISINMLSSSVSDDIFTSTLCEIIFANKYYNSYLQLLPFS